MKKEKSIIQRMQSYQDACTLTKTEPLTLEHFKQILPEEDAQYHYSMHRIKTGVKAMKEGVKLDYNDATQRKYFPWWDMEVYDDQPGSGFVLDDVFNGDTIATVGACLSMIEIEHVRHMAKVFYVDYKIIMKSE